MPIASLMLLHHRLYSCSNLKPWVSVCLKWDTLKGKCVLQKEATPSTTLLRPLPKLWHICNASQCNFSISSDFEAGAILSFYQQCICCSVYSYVIGVSFIPSCYTLFSHEIASPIVQIWDWTVHHLLQVIVICRMFQWNIDMEKNMMDMVIHFSGRGPPWW